ncbi:DUF1822 family protein [Mastigocoleus testarum]|uniref:DUF1822 domain-containing protein n=1 Tax=Mastigocoleus testarum BC008 TaxID=371196 RepID=A0A0V7ZLT0_9CYAN|nr:DUF1822 family protein [Mastigocoleus testarum]KST65374.1 hypothetical protein BC008_21495 [Mastigocoleus testarum BC008]KST70438.1 hypothetical protein BC008_45450 [Mastigocoleus testarum BC008]
MIKSSLPIPRKLASRLKIIGLEPEDFEKAREISQEVNDERCRWQTYLNALALLGFAEWLQGQIPNVKINSDKCSVLQPECTTSSNTIYHLQVGAFKLCLIVVYELKHESLKIAHESIQEVNLASQFYVLIEVLEEQEELIVHGFIRYDEIAKYHQSLQGELEGVNYGKDFSVPLSCFDPEVNNLLLYTRFLKVNAIPLPGYGHSIIDATNKKIKSLVDIGKWLGGIFDEGWQSLEDFYPPSLYWEERKSLSWGPARSKFKSTQNLEITGSKKYDLGLKLKNKKVALVIRVKPDDELKDEKDVIVQVCPDEVQQYLPQNLKLKVILNPDTENSDTEEVIARSSDNFIQLEFNESPGKQFKVEISYEELAIVEQFVL